MDWCFGGGSALFGRICFLMAQGNVGRLELTCACWEDDLRVARSFLMDDGLGHLRGVRFYLDGFCLCISGVYHSDIGKTFF